MDTNAPPYSECELFKNGQKFLIVSYDLLGGRGRLDNLCLTAGMFKFSNGIG